MTSEKTKIKNFEFLPLSAQKSFLNIYLLACLQLGRPLCYRGQPKAGTGYKMLSVPFVFSMSRFQGSAFRCDKIVVIVTLLEAIEDILDKDCNFLGNDKFQETTS